jgi:DegV family protein with EDD domain
MSVRIVTDSTCDLPNHTVEALGLRVLPLYIHVGNTDYLDGVDMSREQFYSGLPTFPSHPTTAAPGIEVFERMYNELASEGADGILSIHIAESLSNVVNVARLAAQRVSRLPVRVIDSGQLTLGVGLEAMAAAQAAQAGATLEEVERLVQDMIPRTHTFAALSTVEFLRRSGRLTQFQSGLATVLKILPLLKMHRGVAEMEKIRTEQRAITRVLMLLRERLPIERLAVVHTNAPFKAKALYERAKPMLAEIPEPIYGSVTPVIGAHIGPGAVGFVCVERKRSADSSRQ